VQGYKSDRLSEAKPFAGAAPTADFVPPADIHAGQPAVVRCTSHAVAGKTSQWLWDFGDGIPEVTAQSQHMFDKPGNYRVTLIVLNKRGRGGRAEKMAQVLPSNRPPLRH
jgi:PKD repeat protein